MKLLNKSNFEISAKGSNWTKVIFILFVLALGFSPVAYCVDKNDTDIPLDEFLKMNGAKYVGSEDCESCHEKQVKEYKLSTHSRIDVKGAEAQACEMCHGPASIHIAESGGRGNILNPKKDPSTCFSCHTDKKLEFRLPHHHPVLEGKMSCNDCHNAHGDEVRPWTGTSMADTNEACFKCHKDQRGPFVWGHEVVREGCTVCHKVHGSIHEKMLVARDSNLCLRCHTQVNFPTIGKSNHASRMPQGTCWSAGCHTAVHGSNFDDHLRY
jgi:predicted CXXCH cytochrome family protein